MPITDSEQHGVQCALEAHVCPAVVECVAVTGGDCMTLDPLTQMRGVRAIY